MERVEQESSMVGWIDAKAQKVSGGATSWAEKWRDERHHRGEIAGTSKIREGTTKVAGEFWIQQKREKLEELAVSSRSQQQAPGLPRAGDAPGGGSFQL